MPCRIYPSDFELPTGEGSVSITLARVIQTLKTLYQGLAFGFTGSYDRVCAFARQWKDSEQFKAQTSGKGCFIPLRFACGEAFQFDWREDFARISGKQVKLQIAQFKLAHGRAFVLRAYYPQKHEMLFDAHWHAFRIVGGVPKRGIYDNMKTALDLVGRGKERRVNQRFTIMVRFTSSSTTSGVF